MHNSQMAIYTSFCHHSIGVKLYKRCSDIYGFSIGAMILSRAILAPLRRNAENAGFNGPVIIEKVQQQEFEIGYNAAKNITFVNMYEEGIVDPAKVTRSALQNASFIASMILTTECIIVDESQISNESYFGLSQNYKSTKSRILLIVFNSKSFEVSPSILSLWIS